MLEALKIFKTLVVGLKRNMFNDCFFLVFQFFKLLFIFFLLIREFSCILLVYWCCTPSAPFNEIELLRKLIY
jgi:hypothetical protein